MRSMYMDVWSRHTTNLGVTMVTSEAIMVLLLNVLRTTFTLPGSSQRI